MTAVALKLQSQADGSEAARQLGKQGGRPRGSRSSPLAKWLCAEIRDRKRDGYTCRDAFYILQVEEEDAGDSFIVTTDTADCVWREVCGDIAGRRVGWEYFRKLWRNT